MVPTSTVAIILIILEASCRQPRALPILVSPGSPTVPAAQKAVGPLGKGQVLPASSGSACLPSRDRVFFRHQLLCLVTCPQLCLVCGVGVRQVYWLNEYLSPSLLSIVI